MLSFILNFIIYQLIYIHATSNHHHFHHHHQYNTCTTDLTLFAVSLPKMVSRIVTGELNSWKSELSSLKQATIQVILMLSNLSPSLTVIIINSFVIINIIFTIINIIIIIIDISLIIIIIKIIIVMFTSIILLSFYHHQPYHCHH